MNRLAETWRDRGRVEPVGGRRLFVVDLAAHRRSTEPPLLVIHGFPTSSFDFHRVVGRLAESRRVVLCDLLGFGLSDKPDVHYSIELQADLVVGLVEALGWRQLGLLTHDMGDTVGGELLARQLEGSWDVEIVDRTLTNGSIYIDMAHLSPGQLFLLDLPDEKLSVENSPDQGALTAGVTATYSPSTPPDGDVDEALWDMVAHDAGNRLLPRLIRYIEDRRRDEARFTGAIERHPSPLSVVWGREDPIAVVAMTEQLRRARPDIRLQVLDGVGHYPMLEAPDRFAAAVLST